MPASKSALQYAFKLLGYRGRSEKELSDRLRKKGFDPDDICGAVARLKELGYIDDGALALSLKRKSEENKFLGASGARSYMLKMGIPGDIARDALSGYDELKGAGKLIEKRLRTMRGLPPDVARRRLAGALGRRGFSPETIRKALRENGL